MRKKSQVIYWIVFAIFIMIIIVALKYSNKSGRQNADNEPIVNENNEDLFDDANANIKGGDEGADNSSNDSINNTISAREILEKYLNALTAKDKSDAKNYATTQFYTDSFTKDILSGATSAPDGINIMDEGKIVDSDFVYLVKESYNIANQNNAGVNGTYYYRVAKVNGQWLVSYRSESE